MFRSLGLGKGDGVALLASNRVETWAVVTAAAVMGLRYTPLHPLAAEDDQAFIVEDAEIDALIVEGAKFAERGRALKARVPGLKNLLSFGPMEGARESCCRNGVRRARPARGRGRRRGDLLARLYRRDDRALERRDDRASLHRQHGDDDLRRLGLAGRNPLSRRDADHPRRRRQHFPDADARRFYARAARGSKSRAIAAR